MRLRASGRETASVTSAERPVGENSSKKKRKKQNKTKKQPGRLPPGGRDWDQRVVRERDACYFNAIQLKHFVLCSTSSSDSHSVPKRIWKKSSEALLAGEPPAGS